MLHGYAFFIAVIAPVAVILLANIVVLSIVMYKLHQHVKEGSQNLCNGDVKKKSVIGIDKMPEILVKDARIAFSCNFLLGITWVFGLLAVGEATLLFQWLFCIFNSLQGFFIFLFYTVRNQDVRNALSRQKTKSTQRYRVSGKKIKETAKK